MENPKSRDYCVIALNLGYKSLQEIEAIVQHNRKGKKTIADSETIKFYHFTLHYMLVMEVCKLMQSTNIKGENNFASLKRLNKQTIEIVGENYDDTFKSVNLELEQLKNSSIFMKIIDYRDKKLGHSDKFQAKGPLHFRGFNKSEISECILLIESLKEIFNKCISSFNREFILNDNSTTGNFLKFHDEFKEYSEEDRNKFLTWKMLKNQ